MDECVSSIRIGTHFWLGLVHEQLEMSINSREAKIVIDDRSTKSEKLPQYPGRFAANVRRDVSCDSLCVRQQIKGGRMRMVFSSVFFFEN